MTLSKTLRALILCPMVIVSLWAQTFRGEIKGTVEDASGAVIGTAVVTATHKGTGVKRATTSSGSGEFSMPDMPLGPYVVNAAKAGFQTQQSDVEVVVSRVSNMAFKLGVAAQKRFTTPVREWLGFGYFGNKPNKP